MNQIVQMKALKYPDIPHYEWQGELIQQTPDYILVLSKPGRKLIHHTKNAIFTIPHMTLEYFSLTEWFTAAMDIHHGKVVSYYCNVAMPSKREGDTIRFVDLDLDLLKTKGTGWEVHDSDEFEYNSEKYGYSLHLKSAALDSLAALKRKVADQVFPFNDDPLQGLTLNME